MEVKSRVPGKILEINVAEGDAVKAKDLLGTMEAMKMKQAIACPCDGTVQEIKVAVDDRVSAGDTMFVIAE